LNFIGKGDKQRQAQSSDVGEAGFSIFLSKAAISCWCTLLDPDRSDKKKIKTFDI
jgi:hypothetical protein